MQLVGPRRQEGQCRLAAVGEAVVEALEVVPERAARRDAQRLGVGHCLRRFGGALVTRPLVQAVGAALGVDLGVVVVAREARLAACLGAQGDGQQSPALGQLGADPLGREVGLVAARAGVAGDVDADGQERRVGEPAVHRALVGGVALVEAVAGEVARGDHVPCGERRCRRRVGCRGRRGAQRHPGRRSGEQHQQDRRDCRYRGAATAFAGRAFGCAEHCWTPGGRRAGRVTITPPITRVTAVRGNYRLVIQSGSVVEVRGVPATSLEATTGRRQGGFEARALRGSGLAALAPQEPPGGPHTSTTDPGR